MKISKIALIALAAASFGLASCISECTLKNPVECMSFCTKMELEKRLNDNMNSGGWLPSSAKDDPCGHIAADNYRRNGLPVPPAILEDEENCLYYQHHLPF